MHLIKKTKQFQLKEIDTNSEFGTYRNSFGFQFKRHHVKDYVEKKLERIHIKGVGYNVKLTMDSLDICGNEWVLCIYTETANPFEMNGYYECAEKIHIKSYSGKFADIDEIAKYINNRYCKAKKINRSYFYI